MLSLKTEKDIWKMRKAGLLTWAAHELIRKIIRPGITTKEIDAEVEKLFVRNFAVGMFKGVPGRVPYPAVTCISVNDQVVHGIPGDRVIQEGDVVSVDTGCKIDGWCGDAAYTSLVGDVSDEAKKLVETTRGNRAARAYLPSTIVMQVSFVLRGRGQRWGTTPCALR